jgi:tetrahydromethanopterin S-methyltransferase subunit G
MSQPRLAEKNRKVLGILLGVLAGLYTLAVIIVLVKN